MVLSFNKVIEHTSIAREFFSGSFTGKIKCIYLIISDWKFVQFLVPVCAPAPTISKLPRLGIHHDSCHTQAKQSLTAGMKIFHTELSNQRSFEDLGHILPGCLRWQLFESPVPYT